MAKYFQVSNGPRGCYMPDTGYIVRVNTRKELKVILGEEAWYMRDAGFAGANKRAVAWLANAAWRNAHSKRPSYMDHVIPLKPSHADSYCYGLFVSISDRAAWLESQED